MKYNNKKIGKYRSLFEKHVNKSMGRRKGVKISYESHSIHYSIPRVYNPDFTITLPSGRFFHIECKGYFRPEDKVKMKHVKLCNPELDIRFVFPRKNSKDIAWCEKHNYPYAINVVPKEWLLG